MANGFLVSSPILGLMGAASRTAGRSLLPFPQQPTADAYDELMFQRAGNGYVQAPTGEFYAAGSPQAAQVSQTMPQAPAKRERVNPLNVLFRGLAPNLSGALDAERQRLQAEADRPQRLAIQQENERIARALGPQALLAYRSNPQELGTSLGYQYRPQTVAEGSVLAIPGMGSVMANERREVVGDRVVGLGTPDQGPRELLTVNPSYEDVTGRINVTKPVNVAQDSRLVDPMTGQIIAEGIQRPDIQNVAPGGEALAFDAQGNVINRVGSTQVKPMSDADQKAIAEAEANLARIDTTVGRAQTILGQLQSGQLNLGPFTNTVSGLRNAAGRSTTNSLNYENLRNWAEDARNEILQSANGVQTEGDALRALNVILSGSNDERVVQQAITRYVEAKAKTRQVFERDIARRSSAYQAPASSVPPLPPGFVLD